MATLNQSSPTLALTIDVPHPQNTAPVLEFRCMYTSDLRRKQKRWQDGRLKYHTFNRRLMVYDERSNFVGDSHWRKDYEFDDGDKLELERGGILVEVGECIGKRDQDLTELVDKRIKEREERVAAKNAASPMRPQALFDRPQTPAGSALLRPKSLNAVLGNPTGHYGKSVMPNRSPFEQRQLATRVEIENDRPAKRQKQDGTPPSKSGYAQSLMGTKLTLASSRPPSTASIRYEPFRSNIQRAPAATIDLTRNEDEQRTTVKPRIIPAEERAAPKPRRPNKSPPVRSGYASSLTGASLALNKPEGFALKRSAGDLSISTNGIRRAEETGSSSPVEPHSLMENESLEERPPKRIQKHKETMKKTKSRMQNRPIPSHSSPPEVSQPVTLSKSGAKHRDLVTQDSSPGRLIADKPVSTLRIKSRGPRKMMILMERPIYRSPVPASLDDSQPASRNLKSPKLARQSFILSQATMGLDTFCEQQKRGLQGGLNCKQPDSLQDNLSSSPSDSRISDQMIDSFLSRRIKPSERVPPVVSVDHTLIQENYQGAQARKPNPPVKAINVSKRTDTASLELSRSSDFETYRPDNPNTRESSHQRPSSILKVLPQSTVLSIDATSSMIASPPEVVTEKRMNAPIENATSEESSPRKYSLLEAPPPTASDPDQVLKTDGLEDVASTAGLVFLQGERGSSRLGSPDAASTDTSPQPRPSIASKEVAVIENSSSANSNSCADGDVETESPTAEIGNKILKNSPVAQQKTPPLPAYFTSAIMAATDHFRAIIKSSASPSKLMIQDAPPGLEQPYEPANLASGARKLEHASSDVVIKASPKPYPPITKILDHEAQREMAVEPTTGKENISDPALPTIPNTRKAQAKPKLANPATRGPSVQMTARRTVNALASVGNPLSNMLPPPHASIRPGRTVSQDESSRMREAVKEVTPGGPWSRESFDLFGSWRPPGRDTGTSSVNG